MCIKRPEANLRRLGSVALGVALFVGLVTGDGAQAQDVTLPFDSEYPPLSFRGPDGVADGFDVAVARALSDKLGLVPDFIPADFVRIQSGNWPDDWPFAVASMSITDQRREVFDFVGAYYYDFVVLIGAETGGDPLPQPGPGDRIGVCSGCVYRAFLEGNFMIGDGEMGSPRYPDAEIVDFATDTDMLRQLVAADGSITHGVTSARFAEYFRDLGFAITVSSETVFVTPTYIAVPKNSSVAQQDVASAYDALKAEGILSELSVEHLGRDYTDPEMFNEDGPTE
ncbi:Octopine-binding periplasmic protein precursor [Roseivivax sp. THAF40]|uniref:substrate-binding periplasmic protein n=1 Tax=unclassified Roseivivax TaxID=2639302 RepID=UPI00126910C9|nr:MULTISPECIES: transporter substrate-binding domain-containing protein [unclassified Roseivivax]QFS82978.1 Octopine-binding periplasmic protein precursor [Roseivivax sp. THAF197b]QFT46749.1 Octopine-binding periplasmic protein precursor [Roseivivax sp. THAF40]